MVTHDQTLAIARELMAFHAETTGAVPAVAAVNETGEAAASAKAAKSKKSDKKLDTASFITKETRVAAIAAGSRIAFEQLAQAGHTGTGLTLVCHEFLVQTVTEMERLYESKGLKRELSAEDIQRLVKRASMISAQRSASVW